MEKAKSETLRYLGYRQQALEPELENTIEECMAEVRRLSRPLHTWRLFGVEAQPEGMRISGTALLLPGKDIRRHLARAEKAAVMAVSLGAAVDAAIRRWERTDLTRSIVLDACATQYVEEVCDTVEAEIREEAARLGLAANFRYSPGYGDLELAVQPMVLETLDASRRMGLTCTESLILLPRKSVTAIVGLLPPDAEAAAKGGCATCKLRETCTFRKEGEPGGCQGLVKG